MDLLQNWYMYSIYPPESTVHISLTLDQLFGHTDSLTSQNLIIFNQNKRSLLPLSSRNVNGINNTIENNYQNTMHMT